MNAERREMIIEWAENSPVSGLRQVVRECFAEIDRLAALLAELRGESRFEKLP